MYKSHLELISSMPENFEETEEGHEPETAEEIGSSSCSSRRRTGRGIITE